jgi:hypothetical protein
MMISAYEVGAEFEVFTFGVITACAKANDLSHFKIIQGIADIGCSVGQLRID